MQRDLFDVITLAIALLGAVLGVFSTWRVWLNDRVRLRVRVMWARGVGKAPDALRIEVVNLSSFAVTVDAVGLSWRAGGRRVFVTLPERPQIAKQALPIRLEPRAAQAVFFPVAASKHEELQRADAVFVRTACGARAISRGGKAQLLRAAGAAAVLQAEP